mmetsp:Transcript_32712/g.74168  ORF Transcript_32712/g.74168 Transcript_32712/m.74168 type:complete len:109 (+) Transcript_32712:271-597(+)
MELPQKCPCNRLTSNCSISSNMRQVLQTSRLMVPMSCIEVGHLPSYTRHCSLSNLENKGSLLVQKRTLTDCLLPLLPQLVRVLGSEIPFEFWLDWLSEDCQLALSRGY